MVVKWTVVASIVVADVDVDFVDFFLALWCCLYNHYFLPFAVPYMMMAMLKMVVVSLLVFLEIARIYLL